MFRPAILYIDDEKPNLDVFKRAFGADYLVRPCQSAAEALQVLETEDFPLIIADQRMPGMTGIELCEKLVQLKPQSVRMICTAYTETDLLLDAINRGHVHDYIVKPWKKSELKPVIDRAFEDYKNRFEKTEELKRRSERAGQLEGEISRIFDFEGITATSAGLKPTLSLIQKAANSDSTLLLLGETGTGKELLARFAHDVSLRRSNPFVAVHCAALSKSVLESELFGHEKGAFTGADQTRIGRFEEAQNGTLFLDEVGEIPEEMQVKLLRVLQEREIQRVGGNRSIPIQARVIAATHRDLKKLVKEGRFREDLYFRLNVIMVPIPPLRDRKSDIETLANYFLTKFNRQTGKSLDLSPDALSQLTRYDWPGNARELQNIIERAVILGEGDTIEAADLNLDLKSLHAVEHLLPDRIPAQLPVRDQIRAQESQSLTEALRQSNGNISEAARFLGIARSTLFHRLKKYGLI